MVVAPTRRIAALGLIAALLLVPVSAEPASAATKAEKKMVKLINKARAAHGRAKLTTKKSLTTKARNHSAAMAKLGTIFHSNYKIVYGENVGAATSVWKMHSTFMGSDVHRSNILNKKYKRVGVGIVKSGPWLWVTEIFRK